MARKSRIYTLTLEDLRIFDLSWKLEIAADGTMLRGASYFTSFYIRTPAQAAGWLFDDKITEPWQLQFHHAPQTDICVVAGVGTGKTLTVAMSALTHATLTPWFKFLNTAPLAWQSNQMFKAILERIEGTLFKQRFIPEQNDIVQSPYPRVRIRYRYPAWNPEFAAHLSPEFVEYCHQLSLWDQQIESSLEFMSTEKNAQKILTFEGDWVDVDQAEQVEDLTSAVVNLGTRVRGSIRGRDRLGRLSLIANSNDNVELWGIFDLAKEYPDTNLSIKRTTDTNRNLTEAQLGAFRRRIKDPRLIEQYMNAERPVGSGVEFSAEMISRCADLGLSRLLNPNNPLHDFHEVSGAGVIQWALPPDEGRTYFVVGDPGQGRPPHRNAPVVMVFDVSEYPEGPCYLRAFWWGDGGGTYEPWTTQMLYWKQRYRATAAAYDATGGQKVHGETTFKDDLTVYGVDLSNVKKAAYMLHTKIMLQKGKIKWADSIKAIGWQLQKYKLPDEKIAQDIVATFFVLAGLLIMMGYDETRPEEDKKKKEPETYPDRYARPHAERGPALDRMGR